MNGKAIPEAEADWWTTEEVAKVLKVTPLLLRTIARKMELLEFKKGQQTKWSLTDVRMVKKEIERQRAKRDHRTKAIELALILEKEEKT